MYSQKDRYPNLKMGMKSILVSFADFSQSHVFNLYSLDSYKTAHFTKKAGGIHKVSWCIYMLSKSRFSALKENNGKWSSISDPKITLWRDTRRDLLSH